MGSERICSIGLMDMLMSERISAKMTMPIHAESPPISSMPGTSHTAAATAIAETNQRNRKDMANPPILSCAHERDGVQVHLVEAGMHAAAHGILELLACDSERPAVNGSGEQRDVEHLGRTDLFAD